MLYIPKTELTAVDERLFCLLQDIYDPYTGIKRFKDFEYLD